MAGLSRARAAAALLVLLPVFSGAPGAEAEAAETRYALDGDGLSTEIRLAPEADAAPALGDLLRSEALALAEEFRLDRADTSGAAGERRWRVTVTDEARYASPRFISVRRAISADTGGAHPALWYETLTWDAAAGDFIRLDALFPEGAARDEALIALSALIRGQLAERLWNGRPPPDWRARLLAATAPDAAVLSNFTLERAAGPGPGSGAGGLAFHFAPYDVAPYAAGPVTVTAPQALFRQWLSPEMAALFSGAPAR